MDCSELVVDALSGLASHIGQRLENSDRLVMCDAKSAAPWHNFALIKQAFSETDLVDLNTELSAFYGTRSSWLLLDPFHHSLADEFVRVGTPRIMWCENASLFPSPEGIQIRKCDGGDAATLDAVVGEASLGSDSSGPMYRANLFSDEYEAWIAYDNDSPVACAMRFTNSSANYVMDVNTVPSARRRGIATALSSIASQSDALSVLTAAPNATGIYERIGFVDSGQGISYWRLAT